MPRRLLQLENLRSLNSADNIADVFSRLGYDTLRGKSSLDVKELELHPTSDSPKGTLRERAIANAHLIADYSRGTESLQVILFQLQLQEWTTTSAIGNRLWSIAQSLCRRPSNFLVLGTANYDQIVMVNPRKSLDDKLNLKAGIRKLSIDRYSPTAYDRDRLEAIAAHNLSPQQIYQKQIVSKWEFEIDDRVARLYGLTADEIKLIRGE